MSVIHWPFNSQPTIAILKHFNVEIPVEMLMLLNLLNSVVHESVWYIIKHLINAK